jgi:hypothetical protein
MAVETKYNTSHHAGGTPEARIANRLRNSGDPRADHHAVHGTGPTRTHTNVHNAGHVVFSETRARESGPQEQRHADAARTQPTSYTPQDRERDHD